MCYHNHGLCARGATDSAFDSGSKGCRFESCRACHRYYIEAFRSLFIFLQNYLLFFIYPRVTENIEHAIPCIDKEPYRIMRKMKRGGVVLIMVTDWDFLRSFALSGIVTVFVIITVLIGILVLINTVVSKGRSQERRR